MRPAVRDERRLAVGLIALGCLPFAAGAVAGEDGLPGGLACPFRAATGLPCPLCGATRAFALAARGDAELLRYNAAWVAFATLAVLAGVASGGGDRAGRPAAVGLRPRPAGRHRGRLSL